MSIQLMSQVWDIDDSKLTGSRLLLLLALADYANSENICWPSYAKLAQRARVSERQVQRIVQWLVDRGHIEIIIVGNGKGHSTRYCITPKVDIQRAKVDMGDEQRWTSSAPKVDIAVSTEPPIEPPIEPPVGNRASDERHAEVEQRHSELPSPNELMKKTSGEVSRQRAQAKKPHLYSGIDPRLLTQLTNEVKRIRGMPSLIEKPGRDEIEDELRKLAYDLHDAGYTTPESLQTLHAEWKQRAQNFSNPTPYAKQLYEFAVQTTGASPNGANETITVIRTGGDEYL